MCLIDEKENQLVIKAKYTAVDLFCGCGGVTEGLKQCGFEVVAGLDHDPVVKETYVANHPKVSFYNEDVKEFDPEIIRNNDLKGDRLDLLVICAPCQPFSSLNKSKVKKDSRRYLILEAIKFVQVLKPAVIFFENVPGLMQNNGLMRKLKKGLSELGYHLYSGFKVNAADYGVPQRRHRCVMVSTFGTIKIEYPPPITPEGNRVTVRNAIGMLPRLGSGQRDIDDPLHCARNHSEIALKRLAIIPHNGGSRSSLPDDLQLECHRGCEGYPDVYGRMNWDDVAPTLTTGCTDITKGRYAHPEQDRAITMREAALLQTFPETYGFEGSPAQVSRQIGNAVPVQMVKAFAPMFKTTIESVRQNGW